MARARDASPGVLAVESLRLPLVRPVPPLPAAPFDFACARGVEPRRECSPARAGRAPAASVVSTGAPGSGDGGAGADSVVVVAGSWTASWRALRERARSMSLRARCRRFGHEVVPVEAGCEDARFAGARRRWRQRERPAHEQRPDRGADEQACGHPTAAGRHADRRSRGSGDRSCAHRLSISCRAGS